MAGKLRTLRFVALALMATLVACSTGSENMGQAEMGDLKQVSSEEWQTLSQRAVYFGHQSVGSNIMDGVRELVAQKPEIGLRVVSGEPTAAAGVLNEFDIGRNEDPESKNAAFLAATHGALGPKPILMFKYCYVDVTEDTDAKALFNRYQQTIAALRAKHPEAVVVHVTVPLVTNSQMRDYVNSLRGRPTRAMKNATRSRYNELLRAAYAGKEPVFDLAGVESTRADGTPEFATHAGERAYALAREWAADDGHLNAAGRRRAAEQLLLTLASVQSKPLVADLRK